MGDSTKISTVGEVKSLQTDHSLDLHTLCLLILTVLSCGVVSYLLRDVLLPFVFAVFLYFIFRPIVSFIVKRLKAPRLLANVVVMILAFVILLLLGGIITSSFVGLSQSTAMYEQRFNTLVDSFFSTELVQRIGINKGQVLTTLTENAFQLLSSFLGAFVNSVFSLISNSVVVGIYLMFLLFGGKSDAHSDRLGVFSQIRRSVESYILLKSIISLIVGVLTWVILALLGVEMSVVFGLLAFALNFIPNVGPIVAVCLPVPVVALSPSCTLMTVCLVVVLPGLMHFIVGHIVEPNIVGDTLELHPVVILLVLMLAGVMWGPAGMLLAVPLAVVARILLERVEWGSTIVCIMSGREPDRPPVSAPSQPEPKERPKESSETANAAKD